MEKSEEAGKGEKRGESWQMGPTSSELTARVASSLLMQTFRSLARGGQTRTDEQTDRRAKEETSRERERERETNWTADWLWPTCSR